VSTEGSFIILGDRGGKWQKAESNIGVNTGNVGIGAAGGVDIEVINNKMYSTAIKDLSNVAFYSYRYEGEEPCSKHIFSGNIAHWLCYREDRGCPTPRLNKARAMTSSGDPDYCGLTNAQINHSTRVAEDTNMGPEIWNQW
jgi:hypothetical protein